jgi:ABC-2 type transport system ATP-binding protein
MSGSASPDAISAGTSAVSGCEDVAVRTERLTRDYGGTGLFDVDLSVPRGCVYGLVGPNGAGKTTLLSILTGVRRADHGTVHLGMHPDAVAVCPDVPEFDGWLTTAETVRLATSLGHRRPEHGAVAWALQVAGLAEAADRRVGDFSRGMTQRLGLACALVTRPELVILDEPASALDPAGRAEILELVDAMRTEATVMFSSHILSDVQRVADHVGILRRGRLLYQGPTQQLVEKYLSPRWRLHLGDDVEAVERTLAEQSWVARIERDGERTLLLDATTLEAGERGIPTVLADLGARLVYCEPLAADLESAFLALTEEADS